MKAKAPQLIETNQELAAALQNWSTAADLYIDTEFVRTRTYYAQPGLLQIHREGEIYLIDLVSVTELSGIAAVLGRSSSNKVMHSSGEDLSLLWQLCETTPTPLFDTQIAAAFCGLGHSKGYGALVETLLGVQIVKSETRSDWRRRPLTESQLRYAAEDVRHLPALHVALNERLQETGRSEWATAEFAELGPRAHAESSPDLAYRRIRRAAQLPPRQLETLKRLCSWRESTAAQLDRPRGHVLKDDAVVDIAITSPRHLRELSRIKGASEGFVRRHGKQVLGLVEEAQEQETELLPPALGLGSDYKPLIDELKSIVETNAIALGIASELLAGRRQLELYVIHLLHEDRGTSRIYPTLASGWRHEAVGRSYGPASRHG